MVYEKYNMLQYNLKIVEEIDMSNYKIFALNPGSTSTKIALFEGGVCVFSENVTHQAEELKKYNNINEQLPYRREIILKVLEENGYTLKDIDVFVARGGSIYPCVSGVYEVDRQMLEDIKIPVGKVVHPANLGIQIADEFAKAYGGKCFTVNPPVVDEYSNLARVSGIKGIVRSSNLHALNLKETAIRHSVIVGKKYEEANYIVCHIGGGISISAHDHGRMVDGNDIAGGEGPMAPTRCGQIAVADLLQYVEENGLEKAKLLCTKNGGFVSYFGISDARELLKLIDSGNKEAERVWNAMIYQINKYIGAMSIVLKGNVDGILLSGGMVHSKDLVEQICVSCEWIAPVYAYPGEFEMEALASGALRVLEGKEILKTYEGKSVWDGFDNEE